MWLKKFRMSFMIKTSQKKKLEGARRIVDWVKKKLDVEEVF